MPIAMRMLCHRSSLYHQLSRVVLVNERNKDMVVESLRTIAELIIWGDKNEPAIFELFLEKNMLGIFWRILAQEKTPPSVKQQLLQTLSILISNIDAGPSVYFILSNNHINDLISHPCAHRHRARPPPWPATCGHHACLLQCPLPTHLSPSPGSFDLSNEEILAHYVSLLKAIALRLDKHTVQFFIGRDERPPTPQKAAAHAPAFAPASALPPASEPASASASAPAAASASASAPAAASTEPAVAEPALGVSSVRFPLFDEAMKLWANEEQMVRTAVRTIVLSIVRVDDPIVLAFVSRSPRLPRQLSASLRADCGALLARIRDASRGAAAEAAAPAAAQPLWQTTSAASGGGSPPSSAQLGVMESTLRECAVAIVVLAGPWLGLGWSRLGRGWV